MHPTRVAVGAAVAMALLSLTCSLTLTLHPTPRTRTLRLTMAVASRRALLSSSAKALLLGSAGLKMPSPSPSQAATFSLPCANDVSELTHPTTRKSIVLVGTAHISEDSALLVKKIIRDATPEVVMVELDPKRLKIASQNALQVEIPKDASMPQPTPAKKSFYDQIRSVVAGAVLAGLSTLLGNALKGLYGSLEKLGFVAGGEFKAAIEEGHRINARILLGDRDVDITLNRLAEALSSTDMSAIDKLSDKIDALEGNVASGPKADIDYSNKESIGRAVEALKQRKMLSQVMQAVKEEVPQVYEAMIGERDRYMAKALEEVEASRVVAVVGMAHMDGIERNLKLSGFQTQKCVSLK